MKTKKRKNTFFKYLFLDSWHPYLWFCLTAFLLYAQVLTFSEYTYYDDHYLIVENYNHIDELSDIGPAFFEDVTHQAQGGNLYRPMLTLSFILSAQISGTGAFGYHFIDILLHCACCCLLFIAFQYLRFKRTISFAGSILFCVHPALTQAVAWIPGRNDSLLAIFILASLITYIKFLSTNSFKLFITHIFFFTLAIFTKETTIIFPIIALGYLFVQNRKKFISPMTGLFIAGWGAIILNWHILRHLAQIATLNNYLPLIPTVFSRSYIIVYYLGNILWPIDLAFGPIPDDINLINGIISVCLIIFLIISSKKKNWAVIFLGLTWFIAFLLPTFLITSPEKFFEHRIYLPFIGILITLLSLSFPFKTKFKRLIYPAFIIIVGILGLISFIHSKNFKNSLSLLQYDALTSPTDKRTYRNITRMIVPVQLKQELNHVGENFDSLCASQKLLSKEDMNQIIDDLEHKSKSDKNNSEILQSLAAAYFAHGYHLKSEQCFLSAIKNDKNNAHIYYNLGVIYYDGHSYKNAEKVWLHTLLLNPSMIEAYINLTYLYYESGQFEDAYKYCKKAKDLGGQISNELEKEIQNKISKL